MGSGQGWGLGAGGALKSAGLLLDYSADPSQASSTGLALRRAWGSEVGVTRGGRGVLTAQA